MPNSDDELRQLHIELKRILTILYGTILIPDHDDLMEGLDVLVALAYEDRLGQGIDTLKQILTGRVDK